MFGQFRSKKNPCNMRFMHYHSMHYDNFYCIFIIVLNIDKHFYRTTLVSTGLVPREAYASTCPSFYPYITLRLLWTGIPYDAGSTFELWGGCSAFLLCKSKRVSNASHNTTDI